MIRLRALALLFALGFVPLQTAAHVAYVLPEDDFASHMGTDAEYVLDVFRHPENLALMVIALASVLLLVNVASRERAVKTRVTYVLKKARSYQNLIPWILRLSVGIALIGAGTSGVLISPVLSASPHIAGLEVVIGFLILAGLLTFPSVALAAIAYVFALSHDGYMLGNLEFFAAAIALLALTDARPGVDDLFGIPFPAVGPALRPYAPLMLRAGLGGAMIYLAITEKFLMPHASALVVTTYELTKFVPVDVPLWVVGAGLIELLIGLMILIGYRTRLAAAIAAVVLSLTFFNFDEAVFSHVTLFGVTSAVFIFGGGQASIDEASRVRNRT